MLKLQISPEHSGFMERSVSGVYECIRRKILSDGRHYNKPKKSLSSPTSLVRCSHREHV